MVQILIDLPVEVAEQIKRRASQSGRSISAEAEALLAAVPALPPAALHNEAFGTGFAAELITLGITVSDGVALEESLRAIRESRFDSIHRWIDWGLGDEDAETSVGP
jgi:hypothetical protein